MSSDSTDETALPSNDREIIRHLDLEGDGAGSAELHLQMDRDEMECHHCSDRAVWFISQTREKRDHMRFVTNRVATLWCDDCVAPPFRERWASWPMTPDGAL